MNPELEPVIGTLGKAITAGLTLHEVLDGTQTLLVKWALEKCNGKPGKAAKLLKVHRNTIHRILQK